MDPDLPKKQRLFLALYPDTEVRNYLHQLATELLEGTSARVMPESKLHITLKFLGSVDESMLSCLTQKLDQIQGKQFVLRFEGIEYRKRQQMLWAVADTPVELIELAEAVEQSSTGCGLPPNNHAFRPHLTLARKVRKVLALREIDIMETRIEEFSLVRSETLPEGSQYTKLTSWPLHSNPSK